MSDPGKARSLRFRERALDFIKRYPKLLAPILVLTVGLLIAGGLLLSRPSVATRPPSKPIPVVRVVSAQPTAINLRIHSQGSVSPRTESDLIAEVSGRVTSVSPSFASGGFLEAGEVLLEIDDRDYVVALKRAQAAMSRAESQRSLANRALERRSELSKRGVASSVDLDDARNAALVADANYLEAEASLTQAKNDLLRTSIKTPFAGRVRTKHVDVGQFVNRGAPVARIYAVDYAEVRLPIPDDATAHVDLPIDYRGEAGEVPQPEVVLSADFGGKRHSWNGRIVRTEGELDPRTRMIHAVARIDDPYGRGDQPERPPFAVGMFVEAEIVGRKVEGVFALPRSVLRGNDKVVVVDGDGRAYTREVELLQRENDRVLISSGLEAGDRIVTSPLALTVDGMRVEVETDAAQATSR